MADQAPSIHRITAEDLHDDERLAALYVDAVGHGYWSNSALGALEFATLAEKALADDTHDTPGALFFALIKSRDGSHVNQAAETRAMARWPSDMRHKLVETAGEEPQLLVRAGDIEDALATQDIGYSHAVMMQCFLPQRPISAREYDTRHGRAALSVEAGRLGNRDVIGEFIYCDVPSGAKPRLILPYIIGEALRTNSPEIDLGRSLRAFMTKVGVPIAGTNGKALTTQIQNIAAAEIIIAVWADDQMHTEGGRFARKLSFWLERDSNQQSFWTPSMTLSAEFHDAIQEHRVPIDVGHLAKLARSPRRMDLYTWLSYRTPRIRPGRRVSISLGALQTIFAPDISHARNFTVRLRADLAAIAKVYPQFRVEIAGDLLWLERSPPPVPYSRVIHSLQP